MAIPSVWTETGQASTVIDAGKCKGDDAIFDIVSVGELSYSVIRTEHTLLCLLPMGRAARHAWPRSCHYRALYTTPMRSPRGLAQLDGKKWGIVTPEDFIAG